MNKLSVVLATYNEEENLGDCLESIKDIADEIVIVDGSSHDKTVDIAKKFSAKILVTQNHPIFHFNKQKALDLASNNWVLQLDADERVTKQLAEEVEMIINFNNQEIENYQKKILNSKLFLRHQELLEKRDGSIGTKEGEYAAFFVPRLNFFLGKNLRYGGVYPDGVIRLVKKNKAFFPCKSVHEQIIVDGKVGWLSHDLIHEDSPTFKRYLEKNSRYIDLIVLELKNNKVDKNILQFINFMFIKPLGWFLLTQIYHKGILDGFPGFLFSFFSALRFPRAFYRYLKK